MTRLLVAALVVLIPAASIAQMRKTPVSVSHTGQDRVGTLFVAAFKQKVLHSDGYELMKDDEKDLRFYVEMITVDPADTESDQGKRSVVSVVIQSYPSTYPVADMWYHKVIIVNQRQVEDTAKKLLEDMNARWCSHIRNSVGGCPKEKF
jgi:hypothetical protein